MMFSNILACFSVVTPVSEQLKQQPLTLLMKQPNGTLLALQHVPPQLIALAQQQQPPIQPHTTTGQATGPLLINNLNQVLFTQNEQVPVQVPVPVQVQAPVQVQSPIQIQAPVQVQTETQSPPQVTMQAQSTTYVRPQATGVKKKVIIKDTKMTPTGSLKIVKMPAQKSPPAILRIAPETISNASVNLIKSSTLSTSVKQETVPVQTAVPSTTQKLASIPDLIMNIKPESTPSLPTAGVSAGILPVAPPADVPQATTVSLVKEEDVKPEVKSESTTFPLAPVVTAACDQSNQNSVALGFPTGQASLALSAPGSQAMSVAGLQNTKDVLLPLAQIPSPMPIPTPIPRLSTPAPIPSPKIATPPPPPAPIESKPSIGTIDDLISAAGNLSQVNSHLKCFHIVLLSL